MLQSIKITGLFGRFNYELSFPCEGIMIITGPNGYGKSTILRIINNFCNNNIEKVLSYSFNKITIVCDNCSIQITKSKNKFKINNYEFPYPNEKWDRSRRIPKYIRQIGYNEYIDISTSEKIQMMGGFPKQVITGDENIQKLAFSILEVLENEPTSIKINEKMQELQEAFDLIKYVQNNIGKVHFIQEQRLIEKREVTEDERRYIQTKEEYVTVINENSEKLKSELAEIMKQHSSISSNLDSTYIKRLFEADPTQIVSDDVVDKLRKLQEKQDKLQKYGLAEIQNASYLNQLDESKLNRFGIELSIYLEDANTKYNVFESIIDKLELYERIVNEKLTFKKMILSRIDGIVVKTDEGDLLSLNDLSSGEQEILVLFYKLIFESDVNLLLIDEPEISLHIAWQKELMENLKSVVNLKKDIQVIIATHSPQIISHNWDLQIDLGGLHNG